MLSMPSYYPETPIFSNNFPKFTAGDYIAKVIKTELKKNDKNNQVVFYLDIAEGDLEGFFKNRNERFNKEYPTLSIYIPREKQATDTPEEIKKLQNSAGFVKSEILKFKESNPFAQIDENAMRINIHTFIGLKIGIQADNATFTDPKDPLNQINFVKITKFKKISDIKQNSILQNNDNLQEFLNKSPDLDQDLNNFVNTPLPDFCPNITEDNDQKQDSLLIFTLKKIETCDMTNTAYYCNEAIKKGISEQEKETINIAIEEKYGMPLTNLLSSYK